jgi:endonuclease/exonuclease/phosphatase family metal-dependent hydrolase
MQGRWWEYFKIWRSFKAPKKIGENIIRELIDKDPDILGLVEVDTGSIRSRHKNIVTELQENSDLKFAIEKLKYSLNPSKLLQKIPILNSQANAILSRYPFNKITYYEFSKGRKKVVIQAEIALEKPITVILVHLSLGKKTRKIQIEELTKLIQKITTPIIVMGDFNTFYGIDELTPLFEKTKISNYNKKISLQTEPSFKPKKRLDYILTCKEIEILNYTTLPLKYSDHLPLLLDFKIR